MPGLLGVFHLQGLTLLQPKPVRVYPRLKKVRAAAVLESLSCRCQQPPDPKGLTTSLNPSLA